jgi:hypothetical protein
LASRNKPKSRAGIIGTAAAGVSTDAEEFLSAAAAVFRADGYVVPAKE